MDKHIAIIPARAGSKSIVNKNLLKLHGQSLFKMAVNAAKMADMFTDIILSTDIHDAILEYRGDKLVTTQIRPEHLAHDRTLMSDVVMEVLKHYKHTAITKYFWLLQPTSPFRMPEDFMEIKKLLDTKDCGSVISLKRCGDDHPDRTYTVKNGLTKPLRFTNFKNKQDLIEAYRRAGMYYVCDVKRFMSEKTFELHPCRPYIIPDERAVNIDKNVDYTIAINTPWTHPWK